MKNNLYFDADFNFLLLECEESNSNTIHIILHTSEAGNQQLKITVGDGAAQYEELDSDADVNFDLYQALWQENGATVLQLVNADATSEAFTIRFAKIPTASAAINRVDSATFEMRYQGQNEEESGSGGGGRVAGKFNFVEVIRNIQYRLLDEPSGAEGNYNQFSQSVSLKWSDPEDIMTNEPVPATWAGTVVVRKDGSAPLHRWDGVLIVNETTRDSYAETYLEDSSIEENKTYYYGIFPYDERGWYRYTRVLMIETRSIPAPQITDLRAPGATAFVDFYVSPDYVWDYVTLVYKRSSEPTSKTDGTAVDIAGETSAEINNLRDNTLYYFKIFVQEHTSGQQIESVARAIRTGDAPITYIIYDLFFSDFQM